MTEFIKFLEIIGTIAFALSGALVAIGANLDIFGVVFVGCITAVGGGVTRDLLIGIHPPMIFENYLICVIAVTVSVAIFIVAYINRRRFSEVRIRLEKVNNFFDAVGLAAFSVTGAEVAFTHGFEDNVLIVIFVGMITGVGGGIFRDIITDTTPYVFKKHIYALASIFGSLMYYVLRICFDNIPIVSLVPMISVIVIRMLATKYHWSLPKVQLEGKEPK